MNNKSLAVVAYPELHSSDFEFVQNIRRVYDNYFRVMLPHFTLVFPVASLNAADLVEHVRQVTQKTSTFEFVVRYSVLVKDSFSPNTHLFLVPNEGNSDFHRLHDRLYTGLLTSMLRLDIPFIPHITVGNFANGSACKMVADELNEKGYEISGKITSVNVLEIEPNQVRTLERLYLL
jgi:2'-5' RNA ligase